MAVPLAEKAALLDLFDATDGPYWFRNDGWVDPDAEVADWFGVTVEQGHVVGLELGFGGLRGRLPASLGRLPKLRFLHAVHNQLSGPLPPELGQCAGLASVDLCDNQLSGPLPHTLGALAELLSLNLHGNQLSGQIPVELGLCVSLRCLILSSNTLRGRVPETLAWCSRLDTLWLQDNCLSGAIPSALGQLSSPQQLLFHDNNFCGALPHALARWDSLLVLALTDGAVSRVSGADEHYVAQFVSKQTTSRCVLVTVDSRVRMSKRVSVQLAHAVTNTHLRKQLRVRRSWRYSMDREVAQAANNVHARDLRRVRELRQQDLQRYLRDQHATSVQALWRGRAVRKIVSEWHLRAAVIQRRARGMYARGQADREARRAVVLQSGARGFLARSQARRRREAAVVLQRWWARLLPVLAQNAEAWREYWEFSAAVIQRGYRRYRVRAAHFEAKQAALATVVQAAYRGWRTRDRIETQAAQREIEKTEAETLFTMIRNGRIDRMTAELQRLGAPGANGDVDIRDGNGNTPLLVACQNGSLRAAKLCVRYGADVNAQNSAGCTPLHYAEYFGYDEVSAFLWECDARDDIKNADGQTCYQMREQS